jgi:hypothetical protein
MSLFVEVSWGEMLDKVTILLIKSDRMLDSAKVANVRKELEILAEPRSRALAMHLSVSALEAKLKGINEALWDIEDEIRECERAKNFGPRFIELARSVYMTNDQRAQVKRQINDVLGSNIVEEKSYQEY